MFDKLFGFLATSRIPAVVLGLLTFAAFTFVCAAVFAIPEVITGHSRFGLAKDLMAGSVFGMMMGAFIAPAVAFATACARERKP